MDARNGLALEDIRLPRPEIELGPTDWFEYLRLLELPPGFLPGADPAAFHVLVARVAGENVATAMAFDRADRRIVRRALVICVATVVACALLLIASFQPGYPSRFVAFWGIAIHPLAEYKSAAKDAVPRLCEILESDADVDVRWGAARTCPRSARFASSTWSSSAACR